MEEHKDMLGMLEMMPQPSFLVRQGIVTLVNQAARQLLIEPQTPVASMLGNNAEEYEAFESGCLCLTLVLSGCPMQTTITHMEGFDLFAIDQSAEQIELKAMALTASSLRMPLSDMIAISTQLLPSLDQSQDPQILANLAQMNCRLNQLHRIVCNMADAIQYTNDTPRMYCRDVCAILDEIFERAAVLVSQAGHELTYCGLNKAVYTMVEVNRLERAIYNILSNAMKNAEESIRIEAKLVQKNNKLYLSIQDTGPGIPSHMLGSVYSRYRRQPGLEPHPTGLGLGMVLVRAAAATHGGTVLITQPKGYGTRFTISMEIRMEPNANIYSTSHSPDYAGERDHGLLELSDILPPELYKIN